MEKDLMKNARTAWRIEEETIKLDELTGVIIAILDKLEDFCDKSIEFDHEFDRVIRPLFDVLIRCYTDSIDNLNAIVSDMDKPADAD